MASDGSFQPVQMPDYGQTMQTILGLQRGRQALQTGQYIQDKAQADSEQASASNQALQRVQAMTVNGAAQGKWRKNDGSFDSDAYQQDATAVGGIYAQDSIKKFTDNANDLVRNKQALENLTNTQRNRIGAVFGSLANKKDLSAADFANAAESIQGDDASPNIRRLTTQFLAHIPPAGTPEELQEYARRAATAGGTAQDAAAASAPNVATMVGPKGLTPVNLNPNAPGGTGPVGAPMPQGIAPGYTQGPNGQIIRVGNNGIQAAPTVGGADSGGPSNAAPSIGAKLQPMQRPGINAPKGDQDRYTAQMEQSRQHVSDVSAAANDTQNGVGPTRYRNDQIQDILNSKTFSPTGPGSEQLNWIASKVPGESGDAYQKLGHYLAQNSAAIATKMGVPGTNAGAEQASAAAGSTSQNKGALLEVTKVNDAMNTALDYYNRGLAKISNNGADPSKVAAYKQAFGQNFDMNTLRYDDALRRGDKAEMDSIVSKFGPEGSKQRAQGMQTMAAKRKVLHSLAETGDLPQ